MVFLVKDIYWYVPITLSFISSKGKAYGILVSLELVGINLERIWRYDHINQLPRAHCCLIVVSFNLLCFLTNIYTNSLLFSFDPCF